MAYKNSFKATRERGFYGKLQTTPRVIDPLKPMIAFTFDDGPHPTYTTLIQDILDEYNSAATFFILGVQGEKHPELLRETIERGNEVGNHSYNHKDFTKLTDEELNFQIDTTQKIVEDATGFAPSVLRTPYGFINVELVNKIHLPIILWSLDTKDWENRDPDIIYNTIMKNVKDGDIILMHDTYETTVEAVRRVVPDLIKEGYQIMSVDELSRYRDRPLQVGNVYSNLY